MIKKKYRLIKNSRHVESCKLYRADKQIDESKNNENYNDLNSLLLEPLPENSKNRTKLLMTTLLSSSKNMIMNHKNYPNHQKRNVFNYPLNRCKSMNRFDSVSKKVKINFNIKKKLFFNLNESNSKEVEKNIKVSSKLKVKDIKQKISPFSSNYSSLCSPRNSFISNDKEEPEKEESKEEKKIKKNNFSFSFSKNHINELIFLNFIDNFNNNINLIHNYNEYKTKYFIDINHDNNKLYLKKLFNEAIFDEKILNEYFTPKYTTKKNTFKINNLNVTIKLTSLTLCFYEISKIKSFSSEKIFESYHIDTDYEIKKIITKIRFPFEFLGFFYGINFEDFQKFLLSVIEFDYEKNNFFINSNFVKKIEYCKGAHYFYNEYSYIETFNDKNSKEYFKCHWDINTGKGIKTFIIKITPPQMNIDLKIKNKKKTRFYSNIDIKTMGYFLKEKFDDWDFYILNYFSEFKLFRNQVNIHLSDKYLENSFFVIEENKENKENKIFNLNKTTTILNTKKKDKHIYSFFYSQIALKEKQNYLFEIKIPQINIIYNQPNYKLEKTFDLDIKRMAQLNKLRKNFNQEDLIKYGLIYIKETKKDIEKKMSNSKFLINQKAIHRSNTFNQDVMNKNSSDHLNSNKKFIKKTSPKKWLNNEEKEVKDIKLNIDKYIFNFDEDILKLIKNENYNKYNNINSNINLRKIQNQRQFKKSIFKNSNNNKLNKNLDYLAGMNKKLEIVVGTVVLDWANHAAKRKTIIFDKKESEKLLDLPLMKWRDYIEKNINKYTDDDTKSDSSKMLTHFEINNKRTFKPCKVTRSFSFGCFYK